MTKPNRQQARRILESLPDKELLHISPIARQSIWVHTPHARQAEFLALTCEEALYGGAAGAGKTEVLLMWLAEHVDVPSYSGIFFRRTYMQLSKSNDSALTKSHELYKPLGGVYKAADHKWVFPSGAT